MRRSGARIPSCCTSRPAAKTRSVPSADAQLRAQRRALLRLRAEPVRVDAVRHDLDAFAGSAPSADRALRQIVAAGGDGAGAIENQPRRPSRGGERLGDVDVGSVQADDERPRWRRRAR